MSKYIIGEIYNNRKLLSRNNATKSYELQCIYCKKITTANMKQSLSYNCQCRNTKTKYKIGEVYNGRMLVERVRPAGYLTKCEDCGKISLLQYTNLTKLQCICKRSYYAHTKKHFYRGKSLLEWSRELGIPKNTFNSRMFRGKNIVEALGFIPGVRYDSRGLVICEICGESYNKLGMHIRNTHKILTAEYKKIFGLDQSQSLMSQASIDLARKRNAENYDKVVLDNLIKKGNNTRYKDGHKGRTKDQVSPQTEERLKQLYTYNKRKCTK